MPDDRCDSCGANVRADRTDCEYCGRQVSVLVNGARLCVLIERLIYIGDYRQTEQITTEILKEQPDNAVAWAAKGLSWLHINMLTISVLEGAVRSFEFSRRTGRRDGLVSTLTHQAAQTLLRFSQQLVQQFGALPTKPMFDDIHRVVLAAAQICPEAAPDIAVMLREVDEVGEKKYRMRFQYRETERIHS